MWCWCFLGAIFQERNRFSRENGGREEIGYLVISNPNPRNCGGKKPSFQEKTRFQQVLGLHAHDDGQHHRTAVGLFREEPAQHRAYFLLHGFGLALALHTHVI